MDLFNIKQITLITKINLMQIRISATMLPSSAVKTDYG